MYFLSVVFVCFCVLLVLVMFFLIVVECLLSIFVR